MRKFTITSEYQYGEQQAIEQGTDKTFTLTQRKQLFNEDYYSIYRFIACQNVKADEYPEPDFYVVKISYMPSGSRLNSICIDADLFERIMMNNAYSLITGGADFEKILKE